MHEILLQYLGKKTPCVIDIPVLKTSPIKFNSKSPTWVIASDAEWLMRTNPKMFRKVDEKGKEELEDAADIIAKRDANEKSEEVIDEELGLDDADLSDDDPFKTMTRKDISDESLAKFNTEIKIAGKNKQAVIEAYEEAEKNFLGN